MRTPENITCLTAEGYSAFPAHTITSHRTILLQLARATLSAVALGEDDAVLAAQRAALTKKPPERASAATERKKAAAAREGKNRFARSSVMKIKEVRLVESRRPQLPFQ